MMHYFFSDKAHIFWDDVIEAAVLRWNSTTQNEDFREPLDKLIELAVIKEAKKVLVDKNHRFVSEEDTEWFAKEWLPKLLNAGIQYMAIVTPENTLTNIDMSQTFVRDTPELSYHDFEDVHNAVGWLSGIPA
ncbi:hypothetical protein [Paenibacillus qinlingensis]|uniref:hypothetical protein n=1 Tax=Paenibacillus qinlingensis TaxID=1837343 RepID=UPI0015662835|nr:hypothetical protein [Paenibacillus qinlingensis]